MRLHLNLGRVVGFATLVAAALMVCGCESLFSTNSPAQKLSEGDATGRLIPLKCGDRIRIDMSVPGNITPIPYREEQVKEDGTINVAMLDPLKVVGKSCRDVEIEIARLYISSNIYKSLTVTVAPLDRYYYVGGQVTRPGEQRYNSPITVTKAIQAAGDFTDFANRKKIRLFRTVGDHTEQVTVNYYNVMSHPELDPVVYPGDKIDVLRRKW
jgi:polysaccharide export outer membrane protein